MENTNPWREVKQRRARVWEQSPRGLGGGGFYTRDRTVYLASDVDRARNAELARQDGKADAPLLKAAPDLLAALKDAESKMFALGREFSSPRFTDRYGDGPALLDLAERARAAIAKAEGRAR